MEKLNLREHIDYVTQCTKELGLSQSTVVHYLRHYKAVFLFCTENGIDTFTYQDAADFCKSRYGTPFKTPDNINFRFQNTPPNHKSFGPVFFSILLALS